MGLTMPGYLTIIAKELTRAYTVVAIVRFGPGHAGAIILAGILCTFPHYNITDTQVRLIT